MSIRTRCPYCRHVSVAPARAVGAVGKCPACACWYTVVADGGPPPAPAAEREPVAAPPPAREEPPAPAVNPVVYTTLSPQLDGGTPALADPPAPSGDWVRPAGVVACLLAAAALVTASFAPTTSLARPLSAAGLVAGLVGLVLARGARPGLALVPGLGAAASGLALAAAVLAPSLLGPRYEASRQHSGYDPNAVRAVPLRLEPDAATLEADGWADAGRAAVQQGSVRVQVTGAAVGPVQLVAERRKYTKEKYLTVGVRVQHLGHGGAVEFVHWGTTGVRTVPPATLDIGGRQLTPVDLRPDVPAGLAYAERLSPGRAVDDVLVFPAPTGAGPGRLELPAEAWGGRGAFRFHIPAAMIATSPGPRPGVNSPRGGRP